MGTFSLFPPLRKTTAGDVDALYTFVIGVSVIMTVLIFACVFYFRHSVPAPQRRGTAH